MRKAAAGVALMIVALVGGAYCYFEAFTDRGWTNVDEDAVEEAREYDGAPVLWVGEEFDVDGDGDLDPLSGFRVYERRSAGSLPERIVVGYGQCKFPEGEGGCALPLTIVVEYTCRPVTRGSHPLLRGAIETQSSHLSLIADDAIITIFASRIDERRVVEALRGANARASHITTSSDLGDIVRGDCRIR